MKRLLLIKENQITQVKEYSTFPCIRRCKSLGSLKLFLGYAPPLPGARILGFLSPVSSGCTFPLRVGSGVVAVWWFNGRHYVPILSSLRAHHRASVVADGCHSLCLLTWQVAFLVYSNQIISLSRHWAHSRGLENYISLVSFWRDWNPGSRSICVLKKEPGWEKLINIPVIKPAVQASVWFLPFILWCQDTSHIY